MLDLQLLRETLRMVVGSLLTHKMRAALTLAGVVTGTGVVALVGAVLTGLSERIVQVTDRSTPNVIYFTKEERIGPSFEEPTAEERQ